VETVLSFFGIATGGTIDLVIEEIPLSVATLEGETDADVAAAINADPGLAALGVTAIALGSQVATTGELTAFEVNDPGLGAPRVPALSDGGFSARSWWSPACSSHPADATAGPLGEAPRKQPRSGIGRPSPG
jgi:hypothetical protein